MGLASRSSYLLRFLRAGLILFIPTELRWVPMVTFHLWPNWFTSIRMFALGSSHRFYLYDGHCDMRKSFDGLCGLVISGMQRQPTSGEVFVFLNRNRTHIKLLHWEKGGFVLYYKRLESGTFSPPVVKNGELFWSDLVLMVEGIQVVKSIQKKRYPLP